MYKHVGKVLVSHNKLPCELKMRFLCLNTLGSCVEDIVCMLMFIFFI